MPHTALAPADVFVRRSNLRRLAFLLLGAGAAVLLAVFVLVGVRTATAEASAPFLPDASSGHVAEGTVVTLADASLPAIAKLDPALREALRLAEADALADGIRFEVTSGWRSDRYQQWLLEDAIERYGSEETARRFVATPDASRHVTGDAVDIVPLDAQLWLSQHGWRYGLCQTYANERWHFELATAPGSTCPEMKADAAS
jgi:D-alanyl-D-alanine carboxypeptidase